MSGRAGTPEFLLGVDGGNTKCVALVARRDGSIVGAGRAGCADVHGAITPESALCEIETAASRAIAAAGATAAAIEAAVFSLAGADWPEDFALLRDELTQRLAGLNRLEVVNDAVGALRAGTSDGVGVAVVCGTGGCAAARSAAGAIWHSSFWGRNTGARAIGKQAFDAIVAAELGIAPATSLTQDVLELLGAASVEDVLYSFTRREAGRRRAEPAFLAPAVMRAATGGDEVARQIVIEQGATLGRIAAAGARIVGLEREPFPVVLLGGVLRDEGAPLLADEILSRLPGGVRVQSRFEPAVGALLMAFDAAGIAPDASHLLETLPDAELFASAALT